VIGHGAFLSLWGGSRPSLAFPASSLPETEAGSTARPLARGRSAAQDGKAAIYFVSRCKATGCAGRGGK